MSPTVPRLCFEQGGHGRVHRPATVGEAALEAVIKLYRADRISPDPRPRYLKGMYISLDRSVPVSIQVDGRCAHERTVAG